MTKHNRNLLTFTTLVLAALTLTAGLTSAAVQDDKKMREVYRARLVDTSNRNSGLAGMADFIVTGWTVTAERTMLINTLRDKGHDDFIQALRKREDKGYFSPQTTQTSGQGSARFRYVYKVDNDDGSHRVVIVTDRRLASTMTTSEIREYDVSMVTMDFPADSDTGTGTLYLAVRVSWDKEKDRMKLESPGSDGMTLTNVKLVK
jgi:hypothetical protein